jgi:hypothetical protein
MVTREDIGSGLKQEGSILRVAIKLQPPLENLREIDKQVLFLELLLDQGDAVVVEEGGEGCKEIG